MATQPEARVPEAAPAVDPVTVEVIRGAMETVAYEMATHVSLTATTPILNQSNERNATILDGRGALAALSVGIPQFMLSSTLPVRFALEFFEEEGLNAGDVLVANDPYHGGGHLPDYNVFAPVVVDGELVLIASIQCHHADTGGGMPGGYNAEAIDIWAEGVRFPAVKLYDRGVERRDITYLLKVNNRTPTFIGDLRAQVGAAQLGARRLAEIVGALRRRGGAGRVPALDRVRRAALPRGGGVVARRHLRGRRVGRSRSDREPGHPRARGGHGRRRSAEGGLHRQRHAPGPEGLLGVRQHARLHGGAARLDDGSGDPEERGLLQLDRAGRARGLRAQPAARQDRRGGHAPPGRRGRRGDLQGARAGAARAGLSADLQARHADGDLRHAPRDRRRVRRPLGRRAGRLLQRGEGPGRLGLDARLVRQPDPRHGRGERVDLPGAPRVLRLRDRHGRARPVARLPGLARGEARARAGDGHDLHGRHEVPDVGRRGRLRRLAQRARHQLRERARARRSAAWPTACRTRAGAGVPLHLRRRRRLGRSAASAIPSWCSTTCTTSSCRSRRPSATTASSFTGSLEDDTLAVDHDATKALRERQSGG